MKDNVFIKEYENGVKILFEKAPHAKYVAFSAMFFVGGVQEGVGEEGISHCIEHMVSKGTKNRTVLEMSEEMEKVGAYKNAWTSNDETCYNFKCLPESFAVCAEVYGDMLSNPTFPENEFVQEKNVICEEIQSYEDDPEQDAFMNAEIAMISQTLPNAHDIGGTKQQVQVLTTDKLRAFMDKHYRGDNIIFSIVGNLEFNYVCELIEKNFAFYLDPCRTFIQNKKEFLSIQPKEKITTLQKDVKQVKIHVMFNAPTRLAENRFVAQIYQQILGYGDSSRLWVNIREQKGLAYHVQTFYNPYKNFGYIGIYVATSPENVSLCCKEIKAEMKKLANEKVSLEELEKAKMIYKSALAYGAQDYSRMADNNAKQLKYFKTVFSHEETINQINKITLEDVQTFAKQIYKEELVVVCASGNNVDMSNFEVIIK